jgi:hypothetical protein
VSVVLVVVLDLILRIFSEDKASRRGKKEEAE